MDVLAASSAASSSNSFATDVNALGSLRGRATSDPKGTIKEAAKQFESLFMNEVMKSMRQATMSSGMMDNAGTQMGQDMLDTQFANKMTGLKGGLGDAIIKQLERQMGGSGATPGKAAMKVAALAPAGAAGSAASTGSVSQRQADFVAAHTDAAQAAEAQTGIPATFMIAQAAHESGWGRRDIKNADGSPSHNLFAIKAGTNWTGATTDVTTTEYINGQAHRMVQKFRSYGSDAEAFADYARLMKDSPRYAQAVAAASNTNTTTVASASKFAANLQKAGYATDPAYADKLTKMINTTLRVQRSMA